MEEQHALVYRFEDMIGSLRAAIEQFTDKRTGANTNYTMIDAGAGAFSVFFTQCPSFLAHQRLLHERYGIDNARTLFGIQDIPSDNHIRALLDPVSADTLTPVFMNCFTALEQSGHLESFRVGIGRNDLLIALDGTEYFSSSKIHCSNCSHKTHKEGKRTYSHAMINPVVVSPIKKQALALPAEFIIPQDGDRKQDCEQKAAKRWIDRYANSYAPRHATLLGDDLYAHQPLCETITQAGFNFILVCKPDSHKTIYEWIEGICETKVVRKRHTGRYGHTYETWTYRYCHDIPLRDGDDGLLVNWFEVTIEREGKRLYRNAWITNHLLTAETVETLVSCGRTRWKTENENNNTLKTKGYYLEHNYGHGKSHLASLLATMNILAFLFHTMLEFMNKQYRLLRLMSGRRDTFFNDIRALFKFHVYSSLDSMLQWMIDGLRQPHDIATITVPI